MKQLGAVVPGLGYVFSLAICVAFEKPFIANWGKSGRELTWFVLAPALFALAHLVAGRWLQGTRDYRALEVLWGGAAAVGLASHWQSLGAIGPTLSLLRYALLGIAGCLFCISAVVQRPLFAERDASGPILGRVLVAVVGIVTLAVWLGILTIAVYVTPFPAALAPPIKGLGREQVWSSDWRNYLSWMAWSPDSRSIVGQGQRVWLVTPEKKTASALPVQGMISPDLPWDQHGDGFYYTPTRAGNPGIWFASVKTGALRNVIEQASGLPTCSPDGTKVAFDARRGLTVAGTDGSNPRIVAESGEVPRWSPDGKHLLVIRTTDEGGSYWMVSLNGRSWSLPVPVGELDEVAWVSGNTFATIAVTTGPTIPLLGVRRTTAVTVWDLKGRPVRQYSLGSYLGDGSCGIAASRDGRRLAIATDMMIPFAESLLMLDLKSGRLRRLPASPYGGAGLAWSADGKSLALSDVVEVTHDEGYSYLAVISGFRY